MMRAVWIKHSKGNVEPPRECLIFPTIIGGKSYLNVVLEMQSPLDEKGWKDDAVNSYTLFKYQFDGDKLVLNAIDGHVKAKAIENGEVEGLPSRINPNSPVHRQHREPRALRCRCSCRFVEYGGLAVDGASESWQEAVSVVRGSDLTVGCGRRKMIDGVDAYCTLRAAYPPLPRWLK